MQTMKYFSVVTTKSGNSQILWKDTNMRIYEHTYRTAALHVLFSTDDINRP